MSRLTLGNVVKVAAVVVFFPLLAYLVLVIGAVKKKLRVILEGLLYAGAFSTAVFVLDFWGPPILLALTAMGASGVRSWHLRDLWLPKRRRWWHRFSATEPSATVEPEAAPTRWRAPSTCPPPSRGCECTPIGTGAPCPPR